MRLSLGIDSWLAQAGTSSTRLSAGSSFRGRLRHIEKEEPSQRLRGAGC